MTENYLGVTVLNTSPLGDDKPKLFITENAALNALTFTISTPSQTPITLTQDQVFTVTPPRSLWAGNVGIAGSDWQIQPHSGRFNNWTIQPSKQMTVVKDQPVSFQFENLTISDKDDLGKGLFWTIAWDGFGNIAGGSSETKIFVYLPVKQNLNMKAALDPGTQIQPLNGAGQQIGNYLQAYSVPYFPQYSGEVFSTPPNTNGIYTQHKIYLQNNGKDITFSGDSQFLLNFTLSDDSQIDINALCSKSNFVNIVVEQIFNDPSQKWKTIQQQESQMAWLLQPGEGMVLSHGASAIFQISNIYTTLPAYITPVYLSYAGIPETSPGLLAFDLFKSETPPAVPVLTVDGQAVPREHEGHRQSTDNPLDVGLEQKVELGWATVGATQAQLDPKKGKNIPVALSGSYMWTPYPTAESPGVISLATTPLVEGGNQWVFNLKEPQIESFLANNQSPASQDFGPTYFTWKTRFASSVTLKNQAGSVLVQYEQQNNPTEVDNGAYLLPLLQQDETFTLIADGYLGPVSKTVAVRMNPTRISDFSANGQNPLEMSAAPVTLAWKTTDVLALTLFDSSMKKLVRYNRETDPNLIDQGTFVIPIVATDQSYTLQADGFGPSLKKTVQVNAVRGFTFSYNPKSSAEAPGGTFNLSYDFSSVDYGTLGLILELFKGELIYGGISKNLSGAIKKGQVTMPFTNKSWPEGLGNLKKGTPLKVMVFLSFFQSFQNPPFYEHGWTYEFKYLE